MNKIFFIILILIVLVILYVKPKEQFMNANFNDHYDKMNNIEVPVHPFHNDIQLADNKCLYQPTKNLHNNISQKINYNIINEDVINEKNNCCNIIEKQQLKLNKNPYDFRFHRSNNSKGLYKNSITFGSQ